jgi:antitoxin component YwqK of YwqJK toxin-antitoxin module
MAFLALILTLAAPPKDGPFVEHWKNGKKKTEGAYKDGRLHGLWRTWHENGKPAREVEYDKGMRDGRCAEWYDNGQLKRDWRYEDGKPASGTWKEWHRNGALHTSIKVGKNGKPPTQTQVLFHDNGQKEAQGKWKDGLQEGKWTYWHRNGKRARVVTFKKGQPDGWETTWDETGKRTSRVKWKNGRRVD